MSVHKLSEYIKNNNKITGAIQEWINELVYTE